MQKLMVIDGNSILNRAFYGLPALNAPDGTPTGAVLGFLNMMLKLREEESPTGICVCFDLHAPTFRHQMYGEYKAGRRPTPPELKSQFPLLKEVLGYMQIPCLSLEGYEADDLLGTISKKVTDAGGTCVLVTGDRDSYQLIGNGTIMKYCGTQNGHSVTKTYDEIKFLLDFGVTPDEYPDVKALMGDSSDNIPGVKGIGEKTAFSLIATYHSLDNCYANLEQAELTASVKKKLADGKEDAYKSQTLVKIVRDAPMTEDPLTFKQEQPQEAELYRLFKRLSLESLIKRLNLSAPTESPAAGEYPLRQVTEIVDPSFFEGLQGKIGLSVDFEGNSLTVANAEGVFTFCSGPFDATDFEEALDMLLAGKCELCVMDAKSIYRYCLSAGKKCPAIAFDGELAMCMCEVAGKTLDQKIYNLFAWEITPDNGSGVFADAALQCEQILLPMLTERGMADLYFQTELPLAYVLAKMEHYGFMVDKGAMVHFGSELDNEIHKLENSIYELAGEKFNINSPVQLGEILFTKLALPHGKKTQRGWSTNADVLGKLADVEIVDKVLKYRTYAKLKSTYVEGLLKEIDADGRIRTRFSQLGAATGRLSSLEPNLQNIPVRSEPGSRMRDFFVASPGNVLVDADYSQIELRILASEAEDAAMIRAFREGVDIHRTTAATVFRIPVEEVTPKQRSFSKAVNFGIVYGISDFALSEDLKISRKEAREMMDRYLETYSGIKAYMHNVVAEAKANGFVTTHFGRRRTLPDLKSSNFNIRSAAERVALNAPIQGTAADIIKKAMVAVDKRIEAEHLTGHLILQVHDELIVECPPAEAEQMKRILEEEMAGVADFAVSLTAEAGIGLSWSEAKN